MPMNYARTAMLLVLLTGLLVMVGALVGGTTGLVIAFLVAMVMNVISLWKSDKMVLRLTKSQEVDAHSGGRLYPIVAEMAERAGLPMPRVYVMANPQPNAFATGRNPQNAAVCASTGLVEMLSNEEIAGVIAHELAHIKNRDTLTMTVAATIGGAISMFGQYLQVGMIFGGGNRDNARGGFLGTLAAMILAPMAAAAVQMAISRSREYQADRLGAMICGNPLWLASSLARIHEATRRIRNPIAEQVPATASMYIVNPLTGRGVDSWFSTHPNIDNRIAQLELLARQMAESGPLPRSLTTRFAQNWNQTPLPRGPWG